MQLKRSGAKRFHQWTRLFERPAKMSWDQSSRQLVLEISRVSDGLNSFNYKLALELPELAQMIDVIAKEGVEKSGDKVAEALGGSVRALTRLSVVASGLAVTGPVTSTASKGAA